MATENVFAQLRTILARLYPEAMDARRVGADTAVALERVALTGSALNMWDALLREVQNDQKLPTLLEVVCADYPTNGELLTAVAACKASLSHVPPMPAHRDDALAPPPLLPTFTAAPTLEEHGLTWLQPFLTADEVARLTAALAEFAQGAANAKRLRDAAEAVADLEKRLMAYHPAQVVDERLRGRILLCSVGFRPLPVILSTLMIQPTQLYLLHSPDSYQHAVAVRDDPALRVLKTLSPQQIHLRPLSLTDAPQNYALLQTIVQENPGQAFVVDISGGVKVMGTSLAAAAFWQRIPVIYQLGEEIGGTIKPFSERLIQVENPFVYFGSAELRSIEELFSHAEYDAALAVCRHLADSTSDRGMLGTLQLLTEFIHVYRDWDAFVHSQPQAGATRKLATRLHKTTQTMQRLRLTFANATHVQQNLAFLTQLEQTWQPAQPNQVDRYRIMDLFAAAQRRAATGKYDDAVARLYRCVEMSAALCLREDCRLGACDPPGFDYFVEQMGSLTHLQAAFAAVAHYPLPTARLTLADQMTLLSFSPQATHQRLVASYRDLAQEGLLAMREQSILAHGTVAVRQEEYEQFQQKCIALLSEVVGGQAELVALLQQASHPHLTLAL